MNNKPVAVTLEKMDIFTMLGVKGTEEEKEAFLDELQDLVWQEFVDTELMDNLDEQSMEKVEKILMDESLSAQQQQQQLQTILTQAVPDYEQVLLILALQLKEDMFYARLDGLKERFKEQQNNLSKVQQAEQLAQQENWKQAVEMVNELK